MRGIRVAVMEAAPTITPTIQSAVLLTFFYSHPLQTLDDSRSHESSSNDRHILFNE